MAQFAILTPFVILSPAKNLGVGVPAPFAHSIYYKTS